MHFVTHGGISVSVRTNDTTNWRETMNATNDRSQAYHTGYEARVQGEPKSANPYHAGTWDAEEWLAGWNDAE